MSSERLFLSYSRADSEAVATVRGLLKARGVATFLDRDDLAAGEPWPEALEKALAEAAAAAVFVGRDGFGRWQKREMYFALDRQALSEGTQAPFPVVPVLLPGADPKTGFLFLNTWVDLRRDIQDTEGLAALERAARGRAPGVAADRDASNFCPYRGLRAFEEEDAPFFFGREELSDRLLKAVLKESFLAVVGPSGSGKSSVVKAGLVPLLRRRRPPEETWDVVSFRPGERPFHRLAAALLPDLEPGMSETDLLLEVEKLGNGLEGGEIRLQDVVDRFLLKSNGTDRLLLVVDQFEELFTLTSTETPRKALVERFLAAVARAPVQVVLTLRADFYGHALRLDRDLSDRMEHAQVNVGPMRREELQRAVEEPARQVGLDFEPGLVGRILDDLADEPGSLPLLEFALTELWERRREGRLTHRAYDDIGEVAGAIARRAETEVQRLSDDELRAARTLFTRLVRLARPDEGTEDTRRRAVVDDLRPVEREVLGRLAGPGIRLLVTGRDGATGEETAEVAHEALVRTWPRLRAWLDEDREFLLWRQRLQLNLADWARTQGDPDALLRGAPLTEAERWLADRAGDLGEEERRLVETSVELRESRRRSEERRRRWQGVVSSAAIVVLLLVAVVIGVLYVRSKQQSEQLWANSVINSADAASDPLVGVLLLGELHGDLRGGELPNHWIATARALAETPIPVALLTGHTATVKRAAFSPDGSRVVTASEDGTARLWQADGTAEPVVLQGHQAPVWSVAFSPDGSRVVTASLDGTARVWQADGTAEPVVLQGHEDSVLGAAFSPDGSRVVTASSDGTARVWQADGTAEPVVFQGHEDSVSSVAFSPDGSQIVTASEDGTARVWQADGTAEPVVLRGHQIAVWSVAFSPDGSRVVTASEDGTARVWQPDGTAEPVVLRGHQTAVWNVAFSPDGSRVVTASEDGTARVWQVDGTAKPVVLRGHEAAVSSAVFSPDGSRVVTASLDRTVRVWQADGTAEPIVLQGHKDSVLSAAFSPDGSCVVTASSDGTARVWQADGTAEPVVLQGHQAAVWSVAFSPDGSRVVTASDDGTARVWQADGTAEPVVLRGHEDSVLSAAFSPDGSRVATASSDGTARVWQADGTAEPVVLQGHQAAVWSVAFSPDGSRVVTASLDQTAWVWQVDGTGEAVVLQDHEAPVLRAAFSHDGSQVVTASLDRTARVWQADGTGEPVVLQGHQAAVWSAAFSPDSSRVVTASSDGTARVWQADGAAEPLVLQGHEDSIWSAAFSPDGSRVVTASSDRTARVWIVGWGALLDRLRGITTACLTTEQRRRLIGEPSEVARARFKECERRHGRAPKAPRGDTETP